MKKRIGPKGYEFNAEFMTEAFGLYCQGFGPTAIAERMHENWPNVCRQTVARIIKKEGWEKQRQNLMALKVCGAEERETAMALLQKIRKRLEELCETSENHQHFAQLLRTVELQGKLLGWLGPSEGGIVLSTNLEMTLYLDALDEVLGDVLKKHKREIKKVYEGKLGKDKKE